MPRPFCFLGLFRRTRHATPAAAAGFLLVLATTSLCGQTTWTGDTGTDWFSGANWTNGVPDRGDDTTIPTGRPRYPVLTGDVRCHDLLVEPGATIAVNGRRIRLSDDLAVSDPMALTGGGTLLFERGSFGNFAVIRSPLVFDGTVICNKRNTGLFFDADTTIARLRIRRGYCGLSDAGRTQTVLGDVRVDRNGFLDTEDGTLIIDGSVDLRGIWIEIDPSGGDTRVRGNWVSSGDHFAFDQRVVFDGGGTSIIQAQDDFDFWTVAVENGTTVVPNRDLHVVGDLEVTGGVFRVDPTLTLRLNGNAAIFDTLDVEPGATLALGPGTLRVESGGSFQAIGDPSPTGDLVLIHADNPAVRYGFQVQPGGEIRASHAYFRDMNAAGLEIHDTPSGVALAQFDHLYFDRGAPGGRLVQLIDNDDALTLWSLQFFDTNGNLAFNVETSGSTAPITIDPYDDDTHGTGFGGPTNENDNGAGTVNPGSIIWGTVTPIDLVEADAIRTPSGVVTVRWETTAEWKIAGYEVRRLEPGRAPARVHAAPIPSRGSPGSGAVYTVDDPRPYGADTEYEIATIDRAGRHAAVARCEPRLASPGVATVSRRPRSGGTSSIPSGAPSGVTSGGTFGAPSGAVTVRAETSGPIALEADALFARGFPEGLPTARVGVWRSGAPWPRRVDDGGDNSFDSGDAIVLVAPGLDDLEVATDAFVIADTGPAPTEPAASLPTLDGTPTAPLPDRSDHVARVSYAPNLLYVASLENGAERDHFFAAALIAPTPHEVELSVDAPIPGAVGTLTVDLELFTDDPLRYVDQLLTLHFDGVALGTLELNGRGHRVLTFEIPGALLTAGDHLVTLETTLAPGATGLAVSFLESVTLDYRRALESYSDGRFELWVEPGEEVEASRLPTGNLFVVRTHDLAGAEAPIELLGVDVTAQPDGTATARWRVPTGGGGRYVVVDDNPTGAATLESAPPTLPPTTPAGAVVIAPVVFHAALEPLVAHRASQGTTLELVASESLFRDYESGRLRSGAIRRYLGDRLAQLPPSTPFAALLVGDATYDPRGELGTSPRQQLPTALIDATAFQAASDASLADVDGDGRPDLALGRLPVATVEECEAVVAKWIAASPSPTPTATLIADIDPRFAAAQDHLALLLDPLYATSTITVNAPDPDASFDALRDAWFNSTLVVYTGHGSRLAWSGANLLTIDDVPELVPGASAGSGATLPFVVSFNCSSAYFIHPGGPSLSEALLLQPNGGALGYYGPTAVTSTVRQTELARALGNAWTEQATVGAAILAAQREVALDPTLREVLTTWVYLGDPTAPLP